MLIMDPSTTPHGFRVWKPVDEYSHDDQDPFHRVLLPVVVNLRGNLRNHSLVVGEVDGKGHINTTVDSEVGDVFNNGGWAPDVDDSLVDSHLVVVPGVGTVTAWGTACCDGKDLGWDSAWTGNLVSVLLGATNDLGASVLEVLNLATTEGHGDLVNVLVDLLILLLNFVSHL